MTLALDLRPPPQVALIPMTPMTFPSRAGGEEISGEIGKSAGSRASFRGEVGEAAQSWTLATGGHDGPCSAAPRADRQRTARGLRGVREDSRACGGPEVNGHRRIGAQEAGLPRPRCGRGVRWEWCPRAGCQRLVGVSGGWHHVLAGH